MFTAEMKKKNPFYNKNGFLSLYNEAKQRSSKAGVVAILDNALKDCKTEDDHKLLLILIFRLGDVPNRQHFIFKNKKKDNGGLGARKQFRWALQWLRNVRPDLFRKKAFLNLVVQYNCWDILVDRRVEGRKATELKIVEPILSMDEIVKFVAFAWPNLNEYERTSLAKYLPFSRRRNNKVVNGKQVPRQAKTLEVNAWRAKLMHLLSAEMSMTAGQLRKVLKSYRAKDMAVLTTVEGGRLLKEMSAEEFMGWLAHVPNGARYRLRKMVEKNTEKWTNIEGRTFADIFKEWELSIKNAQKELRILTDKAESGELSVKEAEDFAKLKKTARVTTGATTLKDELNDLIAGKVKSDVMCDSIAKKIDMKTMMFPVIDTSGSMNGVEIAYANMILTLIIRKLKIEYFANFSSTANIIGYGMKAHIPSGGWGSRINTTTVARPLYDPADSFSETYKRVVKYNTCGGVTRINAVSDLIKQHVAEMGTDFLENHPIILIITDGEFNNNATPSSSLGVFQSTLQSLGWQGLILIADIKGRGTKVTEFKNLQNVVSINITNPGDIQALLEGSYKDMVIDIYQPLLTTFNSNRYKLVRKV